MDTPQNLFRRQTWAVLETKVIASGPAADGDAYGREETLEYVRNLVRKFNSTIPNVLGAGPAEGGTAGNADAEAPSVVVEPDATADLPPELLTWFVAAWPVCEGGLLYRRSMPALTLPLIPFYLPVVSIMGWIEPRDLGRVAQVCRLWRDVAQTRAVVVSVYARLWGIDPSAYCPIFDEGLDLRTALIASVYAGPVARENWW